jgi:predicted dehydrogenase
MARPARRVGILGLGAIGRAVAGALACGMPGLVLAGATSRGEARARVFLAGLPGAPPFLRLEDLLDRAENPRKGKLAYLSTTLGS